MLVSSQDGSQKLKNLYYLKTIFVYQFVYAILPIFLFRLAVLLIQISVLFISPALCNWDATAPLLNRLSANLPKDLKIHTF